MRKTILTCAAFALLAAAPAAHAEADRSGTVGPASPVYAWEGGPGTSVGVNAPVYGGVSVGNLIGCFDDIADCENTLLKVEVAGKLKLVADAADDSKDVLDMYLYESNEAGEFDDQATDMVEGAGAGPSGDEKIEIDLKPGYYMVHIKFFLADADTYKGSAELSGFPTPAAPKPADPAPAPPAPPAQDQSQQQQQPQSQPAEPAQGDQPAAKKKSSKKAACKKKAKKIKNKKKRKKALKRCGKMR